MVRRHVGHQRHIGRSVHRDQLKAGQLDHCHVARLDPFDHRQQCAANVATKVHGLARRFQHFSNQRRAGGLAV
ncbi:hypothetical protein SDC9_176806 [bioreactor metagenome]|uniref:Uncharacterized protein n=1 Tax=bioreactor metagenome TaxID=1076179 RepID=A0A645H0F5_9ZZZZ